MRACMLLLIAAFVVGVSGCEKKASEEDNKAAPQGEGASTEDAATAAPAGETDAAQEEAEDKPPHPDTVDLPKSSPFAGRYEVVSWTQHEACGEAGNPWAEAPSHIELDFGPSPEKGRVMLALGYCPDATAECEQLPGDDRWMVWHSESAETWPEGYAKGSETDLVEGTCAPNVRTYAIERTDDGVKITHTSRKDEGWPADKCEEMRMIQGFDPSRFDVPCVSQDVIVAKKLDAQGQDSPPAP